MLVFRAKQIWEKWAKVVILFLKKLFIPHDISSRMLFNAKSSFFHIEIIINNFFMPQNDTVVVYSFAGILDHNLFVSWILSSFKYLIEQQKYKC